MTSHRPERERALDLLALSLAALVGLSASALGRTPQAAGQGMRCERPVVVEGRLVCEPVQYKGRALAAGDTLAQGRRGRMSPAWLGALEVQLPLNSAPATELESIRGVGPVTAKRLVAGRPFTSVEEVERVHGIGPAKRWAIARRVYLED